MTRMARSFSTPLELRNSLSSPIMEEYAASATPARVIKSPMPPTMSANVNPPMPMATMEKPCSSAVAPEMSPYPTVVMVVKDQ